MAMAPPFTFTLSSCGKAQISCDGNGLGGKGLIGLNQINVVDGQAAFASALRVAGMGPAP